MSATLHVTFNITVSAKVTDTSKEGIEKAIADTHKKVNNSVGSMQYLYNNNCYKMFDAAISIATVTNSLGNVLFAKAY